MTIQGIHLLIYIVAGFTVAYGAMFGLSLLHQEAVAKINFYKSPYFHGIILFILVLILALNPIKFVNQSDAARSAVRNSFDAPAYKVEGPMVETSNTSYSLDQIRDEGSKSRERLDSIFNK